MTNRILIIDGVEIPIPYDAYVEIRHHGVGGESAREERIAAQKALPEMFRESEYGGYGVTTWATRESEANRVEWTVFLT